MSTMAPIFGKDLILGILDVFHSKTKFVKNTEICKKKVGNLTLWGKKMSNLGHCTFPFAQFLLGTEQQVNLLAPTLVHGVGYGPLTVVGMTFSDEHFYDIAIFVLFQQVAAYGDITQFASVQFLEVDAPSAGCDERIAAALSRYCVVAGDGNVVGQGGRRAARHGTAALGGGFGTATVGGGVCHRG